MQELLKGRKASCLHSYAKRGNGQNLYSQAGLRHEDSIMNVTGVVPQPNLLDCFPTHISDK